jgi:hypothetical protein
MLISLIAVLATLAGTQFYADQSTKDFDSDVCANLQITMQQAYEDTLKPEVL